MHLENSGEFESLLINLSILNYEMGDYERAIFYNSKSFNIHTDQKVNYRKWVSSGMILLRKGDYLNSIHSFLEALKVGELEHGVDFAGREHILPNICNGTT